MSVNANAARRRPSFGVGVLVALPELGHHSRHSCRVLQFTVAKAIQRRDPSLEATAIWLMSVRDFVELEDAGSKLASRPHAGFEKQGSRNVFRGETPCLRR
jgi:hypothetical protein